MGSVETKEIVLFPGIPELAVFLISCDWEERNPIRSFMANRDSGC